MNNEEDDSQEYPVEKILEDKIIEGRKHYLIKWEGYDYNSCTWEPIENLNASSLMKEYEYASFIMKKQAHKEPIKLPPEEEEKINQILQVNEIDLIIKVNRNENNVILADCSFKPNSCGISIDNVLIPTYILKDKCPLKLLKYYESRIKFVS